MGDKKRYDVFISYTTDPDEIVAEALEDSLKRFLKPWYRPGPRFKVFRDATNLSPGDGLTGKITDGLDNSKHLVLLLSPASARPGGWVDIETAHWRENQAREAAARPSDDTASETPVGRTITPAITVWPTGTRARPPTNSPTCPASTGTERTPRRRCTGSTMNSRSPSTCGGRTRPVPPTPSS